MLNGATIRLRKTHAAKARIRSDFARLPGVSFVSSEGGSA